VFIGSQFTLLLRAIVAISFMKFHDKNAGEAGKPSKPWRSEGMRIVFFLIVKTAGKLKSITESCDREKSEERCESVMVFRHLSWRLLPPSTSLHIAFCLASSMHCEILFMTAKWKQNKKHEDESEKDGKIYYHNVGK
jgi:hypothetical protein